MKIGAGGFQAQISQDWAPLRKGEYTQQRLAENLSKMNNSSFQNPANRANLFKAVDMLNKTAEMFNYPYMFKVREEEKKKKKVDLINLYKSTVVKELTPEQVLELVKNPEPGKGYALDEEI